MSAVVECLVVGLFWLVNAPPRDTKEHKPTPAVHKSPRFGTRHLQRLTGVPLQECLLNSRCVRFSDF